MFITSVEVVKTTYSRSIIDILLLNEFATNFSRTYGIEAVNTERNNI